MRRKDYQKPTMAIVKLRQQSSILAGSLEPPKESGGTEDYVVNEERTW